MWSLPAHFSPDGFSPDGTVVVPRPTILGPFSAVRGQRQLALSVAFVGDIRIHLAERQRERLRGQTETSVASQVINHRTISWAQVGPRAPAAKNSTVTEDWSTADSLTREKENLGNRLDSPALTAGTAASSQRVSFCGWLPI